MADRYGFPLAGVQVLVLVVALVLAQVEVRVVALVEVQVEAEALVVVEARVEVDLGVLLMECLTWVRYS